MDFSHASDMWKLIPSIEILFFFFLSFNCCISTIKFNLSIGYAQEHDFSIPGPVLEVSKELNQVGPPKPMDLKKKIKSNNIPYLNKKNMLLLFLSSVHVLVFSRF